MLRVVPATQSEGARHEHPQVSPQPNTVFLKIGMEYSGRDRHQQYRYLLSGVQEGGVLNGWDPHL